MPSADLLTNYWPGWLSLIVAIILVLNKLIEESYKFASLFGKVGKALHTRALARHHVDVAAAQFATAVRREVDKARQEWEHEENEAISALNDRLKTVSEVTADQRRHIEELLLQTRTQSAYLEYEALWHNKFRVAAARAGDGSLSLSDLPGHIGYYDFEARYQSDPRWREWIDL